MPYDLITVPCLTDNYAFILRDGETGEVAVIDVPEAGPIQAELTARGWELSQIWLTHHHYDHIDGVPQLLSTHPAKVVGAKADAHRLPPLDVSVGDGDRVRLGDLEAEIIEVYGHTVGHIAFSVPKAETCFTGDSLMALGCGRLFEGTPAQMWKSMQKLLTLPPETQVCSGHEYTAANAKFALTVDPENAALISRTEEVDHARTLGIATVPSSLTTERETNPFLRPADPGIRATLGLPNASDTEVFTEIRKLKDAF
ncbi:MAG: hydroxyacylglutathione hydrolase [Pseudomonadota bacterium]